MNATQKKTTQYGQNVLDIICDVVARDTAMGFIGFAVGRTAEITAYVAKKLGKTNKSVDGALAHLVAEGFLNNAHETDDLGDDKGRCDFKRRGYTSITQAGWQQYSRWDFKKMQEDTPENGYTDTLEKWLEWDGVDTTPLGGWTDIPDWAKLVEEDTTEPPTTTALVPVTDKHVWEMTDEEFARSVRDKSSEDIGQLVQRCCREIDILHKRTAEWYYAAGRYVAWVKDNNLYGEHGDWERWVRHYCNLSPVTVWKWATFYRSYTDDHGNYTYKESFPGERFAIARALGYNVADDEIEDDEKNPTDEEDTEPEDTPVEKPHIHQPTDDPPTPQRIERRKVKQKRRKTHTNNGTARQPIDSPQVRWCGPGQFSFHFKGIHTIRRRELEILAKQIEDILAQDDDYENSKPDTL